MQCEDCRERLTDYLEDALPQAEREALEAHAAACAECARVLRTLVGTVVALRDLPPVPAPPHLREQIRVAVAGARAGRRAPKATAPRVIWAGAGLGALAAAAVLVVAVLLHGPLREGSGPEVAMRPAAAPQAGPPSADRIAGGAVYEEAAEGPGASRVRMRDGARDVARDRRKGGEPPEATALSAPGRLMARAPLTPEAGFAGSGAVAARPAAELSVKPVRDLYVDQPGEIRVAVRANESLRDAAVYLEWMPTDTPDTATKTVLAQRTFNAGDREEYSVSVTPKALSMEAVVRLATKEGETFSSPVARIAAKTDGKMVTAALNGTKPAPPPPPAMESVAEPGAFGAPGVSRPGAGPAGPGGAAPAEGPANRYAPAGGLGSVYDSVPEHHRGAPDADARFSFNLARVKLHDGIREVARRAAVEVRIGQDVANPTVSYNAENVTVGDALQALAARAKCQVVLQDGAWQIEPKPASE